MPAKPITAPCPFCGSTHEQHITIEIDAGNWAVTCEVCEGIGPSDTDPASAVALWGGAAKARFAPAARPQPPRQGVGSW